MRRSGTENRVSVYYDAILDELGNVGSPNTGLFNPKNGLSRDTLVTLGLTCGVNDKFGLSAKCRQNRARKTGTIIQNYSDFGKNLTIGRNMKEITVDSNPSEAVLKKLGVAHWPTWEKDVSVFPWAFVTTEIALIVEGECEMTPADGGPSTTFKAGDLVVFPNGYKGTWEVKKPLKKQFKHKDGNLVKCALSRFKILKNCLKSNN